MKLADLIVTRLIDHSDEIAAAVAREVTKGIMDEIGPKLPDLSNLDDLIMERMPDLSGLPKDITDAMAASLDTIVGAFANIPGGAVTGLTDSLNSILGGIFKGR